jgi:hypothetical protein
VLIVVRTICCRYSGLFFYVSIGTVVLLLVFTTTKQVLEVREQVYGEDRQQKEGEPFSILEDYDLKSYLNINALFAVSSISSLLLQYVNLLLLLRN